MTPTNSQVESSLAALRTDKAASTGASTLSTSDGEITATAHAGTHFHENYDEVLEALPSGLLAHLDETPAVRADHVQEAREHLEHGDVCSADELADRIIGRLVCDRLR